MTDISIRAPARGATKITFLNSGVMIFQSALPRGERPQQQKTKAARHPDFNPRSREGSDVINDVIDYDPVISIRAPARGATDADPNNLPSDTISIRAPARGATFGVSVLGV